MMMTYTQLEDSDVIQQLRNDYLRTLTAPMDGMWESVAIAYATFREMQDQGKRVGYFCLDADNNLLRFHLLPAYQARAQEIFRLIIATHAIQFAIVSTIEPLYFSLCLDLHKHIDIQSYHFRDNTHIEGSFKHGLFRKAEKSDLDGLTSFYQSNTEEPGEWIPAFLHTRLDREELFLLRYQGAIAATGECIPSQHQSPYADLGMVVAQAYRGLGLGSTMLLQLKKHCEEAGWRPICSCAADNHASKKAIEKAGFISEQRMVKVQF